MKIKTAERNCWNVRVIWRWDSEVKPKVRVHLIYTRGFRRQRAGDDIPAGKDKLCGWLTNPSVRTNLTGWMERTRKKRKKKIQRTGVPWAGLFFCQGNYVIEISCIVNSPSVRVSACVATCFYSAENEPRKLAKPASQTALETKAIREACIYKNWLLVSFLSSNGGWKQLPRCALKEQWFHFLKIIMRVSLRKWS